MTTVMTTTDELTAFPVGTEASFDTIIDRELVDRFASVSGDHNPLHVDDDYARRTNFGGPIAHGMISGAFFSRLVGEHLPGERALYRSQELRFVRPIRPDTAVRVRGVVIDCDPALSLLRLRTTVECPKSGEVFVEGEAEVVVRPPVEESVEVQEKTVATDGPLTGQSLLVIGGSRGIGRSVVRQLAEQGADLIVGYRSDEAAAGEACDEVRSFGRRARSLALHLEDHSALREHVADLDLDGVVHCGFGAIVQKGIERGSYDDLTDAFHRAVGGLYAVVQGALPSLKTRGRGAIVALSSTVTMEPPPPNWTAYTVAKSALLGLMRSLAVELGPLGIRVNCVSPTMTETEQNRGLPPRVLDDFRARSPLGRLATPEDVAKTVAFLLSDQASFLTGIDLPVAGGVVMP